MKKTLIALGLSALLVFPGLTTVQAQGQRGGEMRGKREARGRNNAKMRLNRLWRGIGQLEKGKGPLNKAQAIKVVALVRPWSNKPTMNESEAANLFTQISNVLTVAQKNALKKMSEERRGRMRGDGEGRPGGQRGNGEKPRMRGGEKRGEHGGRAGSGDRQRMQQMMGFYKTVNPFYAPTGYKEFKSMPERMQKGMVRRYNASRAILIGLSKKAG